MQGLVNSELIQPHEPKKGISKLSIKMCGKLIEFNLGIR